VYDAGVYLDGTRVERGWFDTRRKLYDESRVRIVVCCTELHPVPVMLLRWVLVRANVPCSGNIKPPHRLSDTRSVASFGARYRYTMLARPRFRLLSDRTR
jgi:hypothetical protein